MLKKYCLIPALFIYFFTIQYVFGLPDFTSTIYPIRSLLEIEKHIDADTVVAFDLDHTIFEGKDLTYGHANWFYDQINYGKTLGYDEQSIIKKLYPQWIYSQQIAQIKPVETFTPQFIKKLQSQGIKVIAVTSRQTALADITQKQLTSIGIDFGTTYWPSNPLALDLGAPTIMQNGVVFCADYNDKGEVLRAYLAKLNTVPAKIIIVEDSFQNINSVIKAFSNDPTRVIGLHYPLVADNTKQQWEPELARQQYYAAYLQHQLPPVFFEQPVLTKQQDKLLAANQAIEDAYEFEIDNKKFLGLPGVFSPRIFGSNDETFIKKIRIKKGMEVLEIGPATGHFTVSAALRGAQKVVAVDISPNAVKNTQLNAQRFAVQTIVQARQGDIFSAITAGEKFDVIFWDIPFNHTEKNNLTLLEQTVYDPQHQLLTRFLTQAATYLKPHGVVYLGYSPTHGNETYLKVLAHHNGWKMKKLQQTGDETIQVALYALRK